MDNDDGSDEVITAPVWSSDYYEEIGNPQITQITQIRKRPASFPAAGSVTQSITHKSKRGVLSLFSDVYLPCHALKHMAIDLPSLLKQAAGLRPVCDAGAY